MALEEERVDLWVERVSLRVWFMEVRHRHKGGVTVIRVVREPSWWWGSGEGGKQLSRGFLFLRFLSL